MKLHRELVKMNRRMRRGRRNSRNEDSVIGGKDRLSDLPDSILLHIMSFFMITEAVQTCILSKRWKDLWKCIPNITIHTSDFTSHSGLFEFVSGFVSCRDGDHPLHSLDFSRHGYFPASILTNLIRYTVSHNVQNLKIYVPYNVGLPSCVFSCQSLTSLDISVSSYDIKRRTRIPKSIELPALVSLRLDSIAFSKDENDNAEPFSACTRLNTLSIVHPMMHPLDLNLENSGTLIISNSKLANLTIDEYADSNIVVLAPNLSSFTLNGNPFLQLRGQEGINIELKSSTLE